MKKRLISTLLVLCMVLTLLPASVLAADMSVPIETQTITADSGVAGAITATGPFTCGDGILTERWGMEQLRINLLL